MLYEERFTRGASFIEKKSTAISLIYLFDERCKAAASCRTPKALFERSLQKTCG
jgi:hypothetical protein